jgi:hypothetical protein
MSAFGGKADIGKSTVRQRINISQGLSEATFLDSYGEAPRRHVDR